MFLVQFFIGKKIHNFPKSGFDYLKKIRSQIQIPDLSYRPGGSFFQLFQKSDSV